MEYEVGKMFEDLNEKFRYLYDALVKKGIIEEVKEEDEKKEDESGKEKQPVK